MLTLILLSLCTFGSISLLTIVILRSIQTKKESKELSRRFKFWMSERNLLSNDPDLKTESKEESFMKRVLIPLGEQVGNWMAEKIPYHQQSAIRKLLIRAGYRDKRSFQLFYGIKLFLAVGCAIISIMYITVDQQAVFILALTTATIGYIIPNTILDKRAQKRKLSIDRVLPDALDLLVICTEAGMGLDQSLLRVAANIGGSGKELAEEIVLTNREINLGQERATCWANLGDRTGSEELKNLTRSIIQSEKVGASISNILRNQSDFLRDRRKQRAEEAAAKTTVKMMIPMALFIFPCIMAVTLGPPVLKLLTTFTGSGTGL